MNKRFSLIAIVVAFASFALAQSFDPAPTMQELQQLMTDKQWQPLLQKLSRVLAIKGTAAQSYDRYEVLMMKGEGNLQLKQIGPAGQAFVEASKVAGVSKENAAVALTTAALAKHATAFVYKRKTPTTQPADAKSFDLFDRDKRKDAFAAFADDENAMLQTKVKAATSATNLHGVVEVMKSLDDLKNAELASSGKTPMTDALVTPLVGHSKDLSDKELSNQRVKVQTIDNSANTVINVGDHPRSSGYGGKPVQGLGTYYKKRGLMGTDMQTLKDAITACTQLSDGDKQMAEMFGDVGKPLLDVAGEAQKLAERAKVLLNNDYTITSTTPAGLK